MNHPAQTRREIILSGFLPQEYQPPLQNRISSGVAQGVIHRFE